MKLIGFIPLYTDDVCIKTHIGKANGKIIVHVMEKHWFFIWCSDRIKLENHQRKYGIGVLYHTRLYRYDVNGIHNGLCATSTKYNTCTHVQALFDKYPIFVRKNHFFYFHRTHIVAPYIFISAVIFNRWKLISHGYFFLLCER